MSAIRTVPLEEFAASLLAALKGDEEAFNELPVGIRAAFTAALLEGRLNRLSAASLADVGGYERATASKSDHWRPVIDALLSDPGGLRRMLSDRATAADRLTDAPDPSALADDLAERKAEVRDLRAEVDRLKNLVQPLQQTVAALTEELSHHLPDRSPTSFGARRRAQHRQSSAVSDDGRG